MTVVGTRPEIIKMAPIINACRKLRISYGLVYADQHYDPCMSQAFFTELEISPVHCRLDVSSGSHAVQTARALVEFDRVMAREKPGLVLVEGDTNTVLAATLAAVKLGIPVGHVEAGLRSYDTRMPEEHNRRVVDHVSTHLFAPTTHAEKTLESENVWGRVHVTGNTVIDSCMRYAPLAMARSKILENVRYHSFALATIHRQENVDDASVLESLVEALTGLDTPVVFPVHPRTMKRLEESGLIGRIGESENVQILSPVGYLDFLKLLMSCDFVLTDSGGVQEEATAAPIRKFVYVLREKTDRPEAVAGGFARVVGTRTDEIIEAVNNRGTLKLPYESPYGDGKAGDRIAEILSEG